MSNAPTTHQTSTKWQAPGNDAFKINFDGYVVGDSATGGFVIRDSLDNPIAASSRKIGKSSVLVSESLTLHDSCLVYAKDKGYSSLEVEGDSKLVIVALNRDAEADPFLSSAFAEVVCSLVSICTFELGWRNSGCVSIEATWRLDKPMMKIEDDDAAGMHGGAARMLDCAGGCLMALRGFLTVMYDC
ncbi:hypothetical protein ACLB2K_011900 [Fragaria x ananassa]